MYLERDNDVYITNDDGELVLCDFEYSGTFENSRIIKTINNFTSFIIILNTNDIIEYDLLD